MNIIWQMIPVFAIGFVFFGLEIAPAFNLITFFISIIFAFLIYFGMTFLLGLSAFWLKKITGLRRIRRVFLGFLGGSFVPLTLFPDWAQQLLHYLPFESTRFVPITIYLGTLSNAEVIRALFVQIIWIAILYAIIYWVWTRAYKMYSSVGV
jgi:ABC-2 type transport system permease protein